MKLSKINGQTSAMGNRQQVRNQNVNNQQSRSSQPAFGMATTQGMKGLIKKNMGPLLEAMNRTEGRAMNGSLIRKCPTDIINYFEKHPLLIDSAPEEVRILSSAGEKAAFRPVGSDNIFGPNNDVTRMESTYSILKYYDKLVANSSEKAQAKLPQLNEALKEQQKNLDEIDNRALSLLYEGKPIEELNRLRPETATKVDNLKESIEEIETAPEKLKKFFNKPAEAEADTTINPKQGWFKRLFSDIFD